jgi:hydrogenase small subunit
VFGIEANADKVGVAAVGVVGAAIGAHAAYSAYTAIKKQRVTAETGTDSNAGDRP